MTDTSPCCGNVQDMKAALNEAGLQIAERVTELETVLNDDLLRQQEELQHRLSTADVEADRCISTGGTALNSADIHVLHIGA